MEGGDLWDLARKHRVTTFEKHIAYICKEVSKGGNTATDPTEVVFTGL